MASYTPNYNLKKPAGTDVVNIDDLNGNMDIVDTQLNSLNSNLNNYVLTPAVLQVSSFDDFKTKIVTTVSSMSGGEIRNIYIQKTGAADDVFKGARWWGQIAKYIDSYVTLLLQSYNGQILRIWNSNGTWDYSNVTDNLTINRTTFSNGEVVTMGKVCTLVVNVAIQASAGGALVTTLPFTLTQMRLFPTITSTAFLQINTDGKVYAVGSGDARTTATFLLDS